MDDKLITKSMLEDFKKRQGNMTGDGYDHSKFAYLDDLDELDLSQYLTSDQIEQFRQDIDIDGYVKQEELEELDLRRFPTSEQIEAFNQNLEKEQYVKQGELEELDMNDVLSRLQALEKAVFG